MSAGPPMPYYRPPLEYVVWMAAWEARTFAPRRPEQIEFDFDAAPQTGAGRAASASGLLPGINPDDASQRRI
jgi:hypothetical protein